MKKIIPLLFLTGLLFGETTSTHDVYTDTWNNFVHASEAWKNTLDHAPGVISVQEYLAWAKMKHDWREVERKFDSYYKNSYSK